MDRQAGGGERQDLAQFRAETVEGTEEAARDEALLRREGAANVERR
ncbi:hypothetical protein [Sorangium sp. So ce1389]